MQHLRDGQLSSSPKGPPELTILDDAAHDRQDMLREAAFYNRTSIISNRCCSIGDSVDSLEGYLHSLWHMYYQLGRHKSHETTDQDRLVLDIVRIQGQGPLTRPVPGLYGVYIARTVEGTLWNDLPFLATDMTDFWINNCAPIKDRICQIALVLFRSTFEDRRELRYSEELDEEQKSRKIDHLDIAHLLPAAYAWFKEAGYNLVQLSDVYWNDCPSTIGQGGQWFIESELGKRSPAGFTPWRWMYWLKHLHEIRHEAKEINEKRLERYATDAIELMVNQANDRNSGILRAYRDGGDALHQEKHLLYAIVKLSGK
ncbi:hypothetical protein COCVIDRAFT_42373 [Bipolaris victoriae FI3]|uniref:Uncharacterized protein n=1 Tax=Bipolaris victoriae (strain FI3) TaxID=930091 RepID=W7EC27_BIPV3|nr:hypothetical protein COCVIDRAFT_42373 [Bipolaris victoriae FI3]